MKKVIAVLSLTLTACTLGKVSPPSTVPVATDAPAQTVTSSDDPLLGVGAPPATTNADMQAANDMPYLLALPKKINDDLTAALTSAKRFNEPMGAQCFQWGIDHPLALPNLQLLNDAANAPKAGIVSTVEATHIVFKLTAEAHLILTQQLAQGSAWRNGLTQACGAWLLDVGMDVPGLLRRLGLGRFIGGLR